jgi:hypothetical protein
MVFRIWDMKTNRFTGEPFPDEASARAYIFIMIKMGSLKEDLIIIPTVN